MLASLNHPHIGAIYGLEEGDGVRALVLELVEGPTLADRLARAAIPLRELLSIARQIADALEKAHRSGIIHRDLKPANVMLTPSGAKLLDFGLAKLRPAGAPIIEGATETGQLTVQGQILGTIQYMAPEQLEGGQVDARTDVFAFGALVYEMASGRPAFDGSSQASLIGAILKTTPPPLAELTPGLPRAFDRLLSICLAKNPDDRWSTAHDVLVQLRGIGDGSHSEPAPVIHRRSWREAVAWTAAAIFAGIAVAAIVVALRASRREASADLLYVLPAEETTLAYGEAPQISPDGQHVAFVASDTSGRSRLYVRKRDAVDPRALTDTEEAALPFWAPDSRRLGFFAQGQLKTIAIAGGAPRAIASAPVPRGGTWNRDNIILFSAQPQTPPQTVPADGGPATPVRAAAGFTGFRMFPWFLPDGRRYLYLHQVPGRERVLGVASLDSEETKELGLSLGQAVYASGHVLSRRDASIVAQPFDLRTVEFNGQPVAIADHVGFNAFTYQALFSVSADGVLAYQASKPSSELVWFDRQGKRLQTALPAGDYNTICLTPDDKQVVYELSGTASGNLDLWAMDLAGSNPTRLTFHPLVEMAPVCSPVSHEVIFATLREGAPNLMRQMIATPGRDTPLLRSPLPKLPSDWSRDGRLVYSLLHPKTNFDIMVVPVAGGDSVPIAATNADERAARISPDGKWIAYVSNENAGSFEVWVQPLPVTGVRWQVSKNGGYQPLWRRDGRELYYIAPDKKLIAVDVRTEASGFATGVSRALMDTRITGWGGINAGAQYAVTADGERFLISTATEGVLPITLALNWTALLEQ